MANFKPLCLVSENDYIGLPLMAESLLGHTEKVKRLLDRGANVNQQDDQGLSPLILASIRGYTDTVRLLLARGAQVHLKTGNGMSALAAASLCGRTETVQLLLDRGSVCTLHWACLGGHTDIVQLFIARGAPINDELNIASLAGHVETVKLLLDHGAQVNLQDKNGVSPLISASYTGSVGSVKYLFSPDQIDINNYNNYDLSTFIRSSVEGHAETIKLLLDHGAQVNMQGNDENLFPLAAACFSGSTETVRLLLDHGAEAKTQDNSALFLASILGHAQIAKLLLDHRADVNGKDINTGMSLLNLACLTAGNLLKHLFYEIGRLPMASVEEHAKTIEVLLRGGAQVNVQDDSGYFPLLLASATGCTKTVKLLLDHGAEVNMQNSDGYTPLSLAIDASRYFPGSNEYMEISKLLLHHAKMSVQAVTSTTTDTIGHYVSSQEASSTTGILNAFAHQRSIEADEEAEENIDENFYSHFDSKIQKLEENLTSKIDSIAAKVANVVNPPGNPQVHTQRSYKTPKMANLFKEMLPLASEWLSIGTLLGLPDGELDAIRVNHSNEVRVCLREMLKTWLNTVDPPPSWERLAEAVKEISKKKAEEICTNYCS